MNRIRLTAAQERQLRETLRHTPDARQYRRSLAVLECARGKPVDEVAQSLQVTRQSIQNWFIRMMSPRRRHRTTDADGS